METMHGLEPLGEVLAAGRRLEPELDAVLLKKWRDAGLIPRPADRPGRGRAVGGRDSLYPAGTIAQLTRLLEIRSGPGRFDPEVALWRLWWEGFPVVADKIRALLGKYVDQAERAVAPFFDGEGGLTDEGLQLLARFGTGQRVDPGLRPVSLRVGRNNMEALVELLLRIRSGRFSAWSPAPAADVSEPELVRSALGLDDLQAAAAELGVKNLIGGDLAAELRAASEALVPERVRDALRFATDGDLRLARDELREPLRQLDDFLFVMRVTPAMYGVLGRVTPTLLEDPRVRAVATMAEAVNSVSPMLAAFRQQDTRGAFLFWLVLSRSPKVRYGLRQITEAGTQFAEMRRQAKAFFAERGLPLEDPRVPTQPLHRPRRDPA